MIHMLSDYRMQPSITMFESSMFVTSERYAAQHDSNGFENFDIAISTGYQAEMHHFPETADIKDRKGLLRKFNDMLRELNISPMYDGRQTVAMLAYIRPEDGKELDVMAEYEKFRDVVIGYSFLTKRPLSIVFHPKQEDDNPGEFWEPHVHILMRHFKPERDVLQEYVCDLFKDPAYEITATRELPQEIAQECTTKSGVKLTRNGAEIKASNGDLYVVSGRRLFCRKADEEKMRFLCSASSIGYAMDKVINIYGGQSEEGDANG